MTRQITAAGCCPHCGRQLVQRNNAGPGGVIRCPVVLLDGERITVPCRFCRQPVELTAAPARPPVPAPQSAPAAPTPVVVRRKLLTQP